MIAGNLNILLQENIAANTENVWQNRREFGEIWVRLTKFREFHKYGIRQYAASESTIIEIKCAKSDFKSPL